MRNMRRFRTGKDDRVDSTSQALTRLMFFVSEPMKDEKEEGWVERVLRKKYKGRTPIGKGEKINVI